jgi:acetylornithine deacetylase/succinyl-diaminopimelate desuccinylase-like protein
MKLDAPIRSYLDSHRLEHLATLKEFLRFASISAQPQHHGDCVQCAHWLRRQVAALGLDARLEEDLPQPLVIAHGPRRPGRPTLLVYGHYDVQPPEPLDLWDSPPFEPVERGGNLYARGASDDKGPVMCWLMAARAWREVAGDWPVNLSFLIEGEEETGSAALGQFIADHKDELACDCIAISDTNMPTADQPAITCGVRGIICVEIKLTAANRDLHSGLYGGAAPNPLNALAALIAGLHDDRGRVMLPRFYDDVQPPSPLELEDWRRVAIDEKSFARELGVAALAGEKGLSVLERTWARPCLDCNGLWGGYMGEGPKTVIPSWARAKISVRLVQRQQADRIAQSVKDYFEQHCPAGCRVEVQLFSADDAWLMPADSPALAMAKAAMTEGFEKPCLLIRSGGSIPVTARFYRELGVHPLMMGYALLDDNVHSPNEKFRLEHLYRGAVASAALMQNLAGKS